MNTLFSPSKIKGLEINNKFVLPPMVCFKFAGENGFVSIKNINHYRALAKGGSGLIIVEATCVSQNGRLSIDQLGIWSDDYIEGLSKIVQVCHENGTKVFIQLHHAGLKTSNMISDEMLTLFDYRNGDILARAITKNEIRAIQQDFINAAIRAEKAGFDGIELHGAHSYLMTQFFSSKVNKRSDQYGGSLENRIRFTIEILQEIKKRVKCTFVVGIRMGCNENGLKTSIDMAKRFEANGFDYLHVSTGFDNTPIDVEVPADFPCNWIVYGATKVKEQVNIPVIAVNLIKTSEQASYLINHNLVDLVAVGRSQLADYNFVKHIKLGEPIVKCLGCKPCKWYKNGEECPKRI